MPASAGFCRADRIVSSRDYLRIQRDGRRVSSKYFAVSVSVTGGPKSPRTRARNTSNTRLGLSVSRRVGSAVARNCVKRAVREWFRTSRDELGNDLDIVVTARRGASAQRAIDVAAELSRLVSKATAMLGPVNPCVSRAVHTEARK